MEDVNNKNRKLIKALELITDYELTKPLDKIDGDLIDSAVNWSLRLQNKDITLSTEEIEEMVSMIPFTDTEEPETDKKVQKSVKVLKKKKVLFIAAIITILVTLLTVVSVAFEWNVFDELKNRFGTVADTPVDISQDISGETVIVFGDNVNYFSVEDVLKTEKSNILYPSKLPFNTTVSKVVLYKEGEYDKLAYVLNNDSITIEVFFNVDISEIIGDIRTETIYLNDIECYVCSFLDIEYTQIYFVYEENVYLISGNNRHELIEIVENLEELE